MFGRRWQVSVLVVLALVAWGAMPASAASDLRPALRVGSQTVMPGARLQVSGTGFGSVEAVDVFVDRTDVHLAVTDRRGAFAGALRAPANSIPGIHWVSAVGRRSGTIARTKVEVLGTASWNPDERAITPGAVTELGSAWSRQIAPYGYVERMVASPDAIFAAGIQSPDASWDRTSAFVTALDVRSGDRLWTYAPSGVWISELALGPGALVVGEEAEWRRSATRFPAHVVALDPRTGAVLWSSDLSMMASTYVHGITISNAAAFVTTSSSDTNGNHSRAQMWSIRLSDGHVLWSVTRDGTAMGAVALSDGTAVTPTTDGVVAFDASTGAQRWSANVRSWDSREIVIANGRVFVTATGAEGSGSFVALGLSDGRRLWNVPLDPWVWVAGIAAVRDRILVSTIAGEASTGDLIAFDAATGRKLWTSPVWSGGAVAAGSVAFSAGDGVVATYDMATGDRALIPANVQRVFAVVNGRVLVTNAGTNGPSIGVLTLPPPPAPPAKTLVADTSQQPDRGIAPHQALTDGWMPVPTDAMQGDLAITSSATFAGQTYVGTRNPSEGGGLFRMTGASLERVGAAGFGDPSNSALEPVSAGGRLYVVADNVNGLQVWASTEGNTFQLVADKGFGDRANDSAVPFVVAGHLVLGVTNERTGLQLWIAGQDPAASFTKVLGVPTHALDRVTGAVVFDGATYVGTAGSTHELLRTSDGISWDEVPVGAVQVSTTSVTPEATFDSELYVIAASPDGFGVLRTADGTTFTPVDQGVAPLPQDVALDGSIVVFDDALYLFASSLDPRQPLDGKILETAPEHGFRLWRSVDGSSWRGVTSPGFGDPHNVLATPLTVGGTLYVATANFEEGDSIYRSTDGLTYAPTFREASTSHTSLGVSMVLDGTYLALFHGDETAGLTVWRSSAPVTTASGSEGHLIALALMLLAVMVAAVTMFLRRGRRQPPKIVPAEGKHVATARPREPVG